MSSCLRVILQYEEIRPPFFKLTRGVSGRYQCVANLGGTGRAGSICLGWGDLLSGPRPTNQMVGGPSSVVADRSTSNGARSPAICRTRNTSGGRREAL
jgi:hypothetical protein